MKRLKKLYTGRKLLLLALSLLIVPVVSLLPTYAGDLGARAVAISSAIPSDLNVTYTINFRPSTPASLGSYSLSFCTNSPLAIDPCTAPAGLDLTPAALTSQSGNTGFSVGAVTANTMVLTRIASAAALVNSVYELQGIQNPSTSNETTYVRIGLHSSLDGSGIAFDSSAVAFSTAGAFTIGLFVPPYLTFCVGVTVAIDCSSILSNIVDFGEFSASSPTAGSTQFSVSTNDPTGYNTFISGQTMTSGTNIIPELGTQTVSQIGTSQFGINLRANSAPTVGADPDGVGTGVVDPLYATPNQFRFSSGDRIAGSPITTEFNRYTVSYLVNINASQPPGIYASTLTFTAVASF